MSPHPTPASGWDGDSSLITRHWILKFVVVPLRVIEPSILSGGRAGSWPVAPRAGTVGRAGSWPRLGRAIVPGAWTPPKPDVPPPPGTAATALPAPPPPPPPA